MDKKIASAVEAKTTAATSGLYEKAIKIYPKSVSGTFDRLRKYCMIALLGLFYILPWIRWNGYQAVLFDLPARKFHLFGLTLWPQDFIYLALLLVISALSLFFVTALAGRVWCGFACPQTVWTEAFMLMEKWTEGDRLRRIKLDRSPWNANKILRKSSKQFLWITFALWTGFTFVGYFTPILDLTAKVVSFALGPWETFWIFFYGFATYGNAGFLREQVCKYMCPYARFQSAMFDRDTLIVSYDAKRGDPSGSRQRSVEPASKGLGDCIDCTLCVQVCPTGIDIRDGLQYECIACAACVDVCDQVMEKMDYPKGLIRYTTENALEGNPSKLLRPRVFVYLAILFVLCTGMMISMLNRTPLRMEVARDRNALYRDIGDGLIENVYTLRIINMTNESQDYQVEVKGLDGLVFASKNSISIESGAAKAMPIRLHMNKRSGHGSKTFMVRLVDVDQPRVNIERVSKFFLPVE